MSGLDLTRRLRDDMRTRGAGIIMLTGGVPESEQHAGDAGCDCVLLKPCAPHELALDIRDVLTSRRHQA